MRGDVATPGLVGRYAEMRGDMGRSRQTTTNVRHPLLEQASLPRHFLDTS